MQVATNALRMKIAMEVFPRLVRERATAANLAHDACAHAEALIKEFERREWLDAPDGEDA